MKKDFFGKFSENTEKKTIPDNNKKKKRKIKEIDDEENDLEVEEEEEENYSNASDEEKFNEEFDEDEEDDNKLTLINSHSNKNKKIEVAELDVEEEEMDQKFLEKEAKKTELRKLRKKFKINITPEEEANPPITSFEELESQYQLKKYLYNNIQRLNYKKPTPIQMQSIPILLSKVDLLSCAPTGFFFPPFLV